MIKQLKIIFFIKDSVPTVQDAFEASRYAAQVCFRNAAYIEDASEPCDGVAGAVPDCYKHFPKADAAIAKRQAELKAFSAKLGDEAAPTKATAKPESEKAPEEKTAKPEAKATASKPPLWNPNPNQGPLP